jgi:hypothetical protein
MFCCLVLFRVIKECWVRSLHGIWNFYLVDI